MYPQAVDNSDLPDAELFRILFKGKWRLPILREIARRPQRLSELRRTIPLATKKMLVDTLYSLERLSWIQRTEHGGSGRRVEYRLSDELSAKIISVLGVIPQASAISSQVRPSTVEPGRPSRAVC